MKQVYILMIAVTISVTGLLKQTSAQTADEVLNKAIAFHDPDQKWSDFSGRVHLSTTFANGRNYGGEIIEIQTREGFYKCTGIANKTVKGIKSGKFFREIDGNSSPGDEMIKKYNLGDENIQQYKGWHYFHFGVLMELKASGLVLENKVETVKFKGDDLCNRHRKPWNFI